jgi:hypothetical protein
MPNQYRLGLTEIKAEVRSIIEKGLLYKIDDGKFTE